MTYRSAVSTYVVAIVVGTMFCLPIPMLIATSDYVPAVALLLVPAGLLLWAGGFLLSVSDDGVAYRSWFRRPKAVRYSDIEECRFHVGYERGESRLLPSIRLSIQKRNPREVIVINLKVFSREAVADLLKRVEPYTVES